MQAPANKMQKNETFTTHTNKFFTDIQKFTIKKCRPS